MPRISPAIDRANAILRAHGSSFCLREGHGSRWVSVYESRPDVTPATAEAPQARTQPRKVVVRSPEPVVPTAAPGQRPLEAAVIQQLQTTIRGLPGPLREGFSKAFRHGFQVPADAATIADRILQQQHHDWIETWLVQQQTGDAT